MPLCNELKLEAQMNISIIPESYCSLHATGMKMICASQECVGIKPHANPMKRDDQEKKNHFFIMDITF